MGAPAAAEGDGTLRAPRTAEHVNSKAPSGEQCRAKPSPPAGRARQRDSGPGRPFRQPPAGQSPPPQPEPHVPHHTPGLANLRPGRASLKTGLGLGVGLGRLACRSIPGLRTKRAPPVAADSKYGRPVDANRLAERAGARRLGALVVRERVRCARPARCRTPSDRVEACLSLGAYSPQFSRS
jgi:hypothetical protein